MSAITVDGVRMSKPRRCTCGAAPEVSTGYRGFEGDGPFLIICNHGDPTSDRFIMSRSWFKSRAVANWNQLIRNESSPRPDEREIAP